MNLQRREEIRKLIAEIASVHIEGMSTAIEIRALDAMRELLAHIATLEQAASERVIADGSRGPTPDYTEEGSAWVPPVEAVPRHIQDLGEEANNLEARLYDAENEIARLKIAHLWRVVEVIHFKYRAGLCKRHQTNRIDRLQSACLAKITELKESQCSTKS